MMPCSCFEPDAADASIFCLSIRYLLPLYQVSFACSRFEPDGADAGIECVLLPQHVSSYVL